MNKNIKIAKELVKMARELLGKQEAVLFDLKEVDDYQEGGRKAGLMLHNSHGFSAQCPWLDKKNDGPSILGELKDIFKHIFRSREEREKEKRLEQSIDEMNNQIDRFKEECNKSIRDFMNSQDKTKYKVFCDDGYGRIDSLDTGKMLLQIATYFEGMKVVEKDGQALIKMEYKPIVVTPFSSDKEQKKFETIPEAIEYMKQILE